MDSYIIYNILSYDKPSRNYLFLLKKNCKVYNDYLKIIKTQERNYTNDMINFVCKPAFYMDIIDDNYSDYEDLKNYLRFISNIPYFRSSNTLKIYDLEQYISIVKDLSHYLTHVGIQSIPEEKKYDMNIYQTFDRTYNKFHNNRYYKKKYIYSGNVYALLLLD